MLIILGNGDKYSEPARGKKEEICNRTNAG